MPDMKDQVFQAVDAIEAADWGKLKDILAQGVPATVATPSGDTLEALANKKKQELSEKAEASSAYHDILAANKAKKACSELFEIGNPLGLTPRMASEKLLEKARHGDWDDQQVPHSVSHLLALGADPNFGNDENVTPLMGAAHDGRLEPLDTLLNAGADPNKGDVHGMRALMFAAHEGRTDVVRRLLEAKANPNEKDNTGWTALTWGAWNGQTAAMQMIVDYGGDLNISNSAGRTALMIAAKYGKLDTCQMIVAAGADLLVVDNTGRTAADICSERARMAYAPAAMAQCASFLEEQTQQARENLQPQVPAPM